MLVEGTGGSLEGFFADAEGLVDVFGWALVAEVPEAAALLEFFQEPIFELVRKVLLGWIEG